MPTIPPNTLPGSLLSRAQGDGTVLPAVDGGESGATARLSPCASSPFCRVTNGIISGRGRRERAHVPVSLLTRFALWLSSGWCDRNCGATPGNGPPRRAGVIDVMTIAAPSHWTVRRRATVPVGWGGTVSCQKPGSLWTHTCLWVLPAHKRGRNTCPG